MFQSYINCFVAVACLLELVDDIGRERMVVGTMSEGATEVVALRDEGFLDYTWCSFFSSMRVNVGHMSRGVLMLFRRRVRLVGISCRVTEPYM